ncbi:MAG: heavy-metal-associated domain-containing protein [Deltaproteobacteria bacterium]|nr:heavy-metal-associated domain-containing protein [Deltaproteobacteria bacterium]
MSFNLLIDGMHCSGCVRRVKKAIESVPGVRLDAVEVEVGRADIHAAANTSTTGGPEVTAPELEAAFIQAIEALGFKAQSA